MRITIVVDVDLEESGFEEDTVKDDIVNFAKDLIICGAENQEVALCVEEVDYEE